MTDPDLPKQIQLLVDNLRKQNTAALSLTDVASVTEVLIGTTQMFFRSIDTSVYRECRALSDYIVNARKEIAAMQPGDLESDRIPRAGLELDAIVQQTEEATNTIMEAAEEIMGADTSDAAAYQATTQDAVMRIFEACSFQDITGQRISKVVETLSHIEQRVHELRGLLGVTEDDIEEARAADQEAETETDPDKALLSGPALHGEGINQSEVDALMNGDAALAAKNPPAAAPSPAPEPAPAPMPKAETPPAPPPAPEPPKPVSPKVLDSMFEEDFDPVAELAEKEAAKAAEAAKAEAEAEAEIATKAAQEVEAASAEATPPAAEAEASEEKVEEQPAEKKAEEKKKKEESVDLPAGEEVSQDDIDALFG